MGQDVRERERERVGVRRWKDSSGVSSETFTSARSVLKSRNGCIQKETDTIRPQEGTPHRKSSLKLYGISAFV